MFLRWGWVLLFFNQAFALTITGIDVSTNAQHHTVVRFHTNEKAQSSSFLLSSPDRLVIDMKDATLKHVSLNKINSQLIQHVRTGKQKNSLRFVFDLTQKINFKTNVKEDWFQITLMPQTLKTSTQPIQSTIKKQTIPMKPLRDVVVIIDPGHGGKDPGAIGPRRHAEKHVVLAIAKRLKAIIDKQTGMKAVLTRDRDVYIGLRERLDIARKYDGDIFISIHADAFKNKNSKGVSVFALSQTGATSEAARWLAEKENYSELGGVDLSSLQDKNDLVRSVLIDLSQTATISASVKVGTQVLQALDILTDLHHNKVEQARFVVLKSPDIPSILVETGFITNPTEEKNLLSHAYQTRLSAAIFQGVKTYFWEYPPYGSRIEALAAIRHYVVKKGDSLSSIAAKHKTSIQRLRQMNQLSKNTILAGQSLVLPSI